MAICHISAIGYFKGNDHLYLWQHGPCGESRSLNSRQYFITTLRYTRIPSFPFAGISAINHFKGKAHLYLWYHDKRGSSFIFGHPAIVYFDFVIYQGTLLTLC